MMFLGTLGRAFKRKSRGYNFQAKTFGCVLPDNTTEPGRNYVDDAKKIAGNLVAHIFWKTSANFDQPWSIGCDL